MMDHTGTTFHGLPHQGEELLPFLVGAINKIVNPRVLEIGCGFGGLLLALASHRPDGRFTGVDIAPANIMAAQRQIAARPELSISLCAGDYITTPLGMFDMVFSNSTLHLITTEFDALFGKIAAELAPAGILIMTVPVPCPCNSGLMALRIGLRAADCILVRQALFGLGSLFYPKLEKTALRDRIAYMFILPCFLFGLWEEARLRTRHGLTLFNKQVQKLVPGKLRHAVLCFHKSCTGAEI